MISRKCEACGGNFDVPRGSLRRLCADEVCRATRRSYRSRQEVAVRRERKELEDFRNDDGIQSMWPEIVAIAREAADMEKPGPEQLAKAVRGCSKPAGVNALRSALMIVSAVAMRWAASLPRTTTLEPAFDRARDPGR